MRVKAEIGKVRKGMRLFAKKTWNIIFKHPTLYSTKLLKDLKLNKVENLQWKINFSIFYDNADVFIFIAGLVLVNVESQTDKNLTGMLASCKLAHYAGEAVSYVHGHQKLNYNFVFMTTSCHMGTQYDLTSSDFLHLFIQFRNPKSDAIRRHRVWKRFGVHQSHSTPD